MALQSIGKTITLLISLGAKATTCFLPKTSIHLALLTANPIILQSIFNAGGSPSYIFSFNEVSTYKFCSIKNAHINIILFYHKLFRVVIR